MIIEILLSFLVFLLVVLGMSISIGFGRRSLQGSCGGLSQVPGIESDCGGQCRRACPKRKNKTA